MKGRSDPPVRVEFRAGRDGYGRAGWAADVIRDREQREDGRWLKILPAYSTSEEAHWIPQHDTRALPNPA
ncbi:hypothetical protein [Streptomyces phytophilus]|uniref:hypothetical protein n=1 Tax=Streptomyces phytophilus TaxID=722715 RepID=UPI0015F0822F|nr:hypothetical protein [Streptomyces phytophilus]